MGYTFSSSFGGIFVSSVVSEEVYDPVYDTTMDSGFIFQLLPSFYRDLMDDKEIFSVYWSGLMQQTAADILNLWQIDYAKSLRDVPVLGQRKWVQLDLVREYSFSEDPLPSYDGSGASYFVWGDQALQGEYTNRTRSETAYFALRRPVSEKASLYFSFDVNVESADRYSSALWGYAQQTDAGKLANFFGVVLLNSETSANTPRPSLLHLDPAGLPTVSIAAFEMATGVDYRLSFNYTASTSATVLEVTELRYLKLSGTAGKTLGELGDTLTNFFVDESVNFDILGIAAGDILIAFGLEYTILSVDGSVLTTAVIGLPVDVTDVPYTIRGPVVVSSTTLDLEGDAADPHFEATKFITGNLDVRCVTPAVFSSLTSLRDKTMLASSKNWNFLDPAFSETVISIPRIQDVITDATFLLTEGTDYYVSNSTIFFQEPPEEGLWAEYVAYDEQYIQANFGANVDLFGASNDQYKARVRGLYYAYWQGPTVSAVRQGVHILVGLPIAEKAGTVESINTSFSGVLGVITVAGVDYLYPLLAGTDLVVGDTVSTFAPLCRGVEIVDYVSDPEWFENLDFNEMKKFHTFEVRLNLDAFTLDTLGLAAQFVDRIKPTWKDYIFLVYKNLEDDIVVSDSIGLTATLKLYDQFCDHIVISYDGLEYEGEEADWKYDQGLAEWDETSAAMRASATMLAGYTLLTNGSAAAVGTDTVWLADIGSGAVTDKYLAVGKYTFGSGGQTSAGLNDFYDVSAGLGDVEVGEFITIAGEGTFEILVVVSPSHIIVDGPMTLSASGVDWYNVGKLKVWAKASIVGSDTMLTLNSVFPGTTGYYVFALMNNDYKDVFYDAFTEECPDEEFVINITYTGLTPPVGPVTVPASTGTSTYTFTTTGEVYSVTLDERVP